MASKFFSERNLKFMLYEVHDVVSLTQYDYYAEHNRKMFDMVLKAAGKVAKDLLFPIFEEMDRKQPELVNGEVKVHPAVRKLMKEFGEGGWITARVPFDLDGEQLPHLIADTCEYVFQCANYSANAYHGLTAGAANLIETFGSKELYDTYTPKMYTGEWQGTMALTEPEAGSSLSDITTMAEPTDAGYYRIKGQKIFISAGDHDGVDNVVHLMLAKIQGAPAGVKGISLFVVPKKRIDETGQLVSKEYAKTRRQGRNVSQKDPSLPPVPIIEHADVKRMLLFQRAVTEGGLSVLMQCSKYLDLQHVVNEEDKEKYNLLLEILTPVAKTYPSEMGIQAISQGLQCLGGSGYCDDYPLEQYYRDSRIHPIHEGTTGIQAMDLLGRKVIMQNGRAFNLLISELEAAISIAMDFSEIQEPAQQLKGALANLQKITGHLLEIAQKQGPEYFLADATLYLEFFGIVAVAWQWLLQGIAAQNALKNGAKNKDLNFYHGKMAALRYFFGYELPKTLGLSERLMRTDGLTVEMRTELFND